MSLVSMIRGTGGKSGFGYASTAESVTAGVDLTGKNILITGCNSGIGQESARVLALRGARIFAAARTTEKAEGAIAGFTGEGHVPLACELSDPASVRACVAAIEERGDSLDVVICNAGIMALPKRELVHGQERQFFTNHVGHFMLVTGILDGLAGDARVVILSSAAHQYPAKGGINFDDLNFERRYVSFRAYGQSKLANLLFAKELARRFEGSGKTANAIHPGVIQTNLLRHMNPILRVASPIAAAIAYKSIPEGAATQCYVAVNPGAAGINGEYFADCNVAKPSRHGRDPELAKRLWEVTEEIVAGL